MENTLKNKAKFFANYLYSCDVSWLRTEDETLQKTELTATDFNWLLNRSNSKLELKNIRSILDVQLIELAKMQGQLQYDENTEIVVFKNTFGNPVVSTGDKIWSENKWTIDLKHGLGKLKWSQVDYLRQNGFCLPYLNMSVEKLIEYGWVVLE